MSLVHVSAGYFPTWVKNKRYSVLMVKLQDCAPCNRALPLYEKVATKSGENMEKNKQIQFGVYTIQDTLQDKLFARDKLGILTVPTFYIYDEKENRYLFVASSAKKINELEKYIASL